MSAPPTDGATIDLQGRASDANIAEVATILRQLFGQSLMAHIVGSEDSDSLDAWADGQATPPDEVALGLRTASAVADLLLAFERPAVIRAWFGGRNRMLDDRPPALLIRTDAASVWRAAKAFRAYG